MQIKIPEQEVKVKIKNVSFTLRGTVHTMVEVRLLDYINSHKDKFIPAAGKRSLLFRRSKKDLEKNGTKKEFFCKCIKKWQEKEIIQLQYG